MADETRHPYLTTEAPAVETTEATPAPTTSARTTSRRSSRLARSATTVPPAPKAAAAPKPAPVKKSWEQWAKEKRTPKLDRDRAPAFNRWAAGKHVTEAEFDAGIHAAANCLIRC